MTTQAKARVSEDESGQSVQLPTGYRFTTDEVYLEHDPDSGTMMLSERPTYAHNEWQSMSQPNRAERLKQLFTRMDAEGGFEFDLEREMLPAEEREWF